MSNETLKGIVEVVRGVVAIDPLAGSGETKYFVTADFIAEARRALDRYDSENDGSEQFDPGLS